MTSDSETAADSIKKTKNSSNLPLVMALIAMAVTFLLAVAGWYVWTQLAAVKNSVQAQSSLVKGQLNEHANSLQVNTKVLQVQISQQQSEIKAMQVNLQTALRSFSQDANYQVINQVSYLVNQANLELVINHNVDQSVHLLKDAKQLLNQLTDPLLFSLKSGLDQDIVLLEKTKSLNVNTLVEQLDHLAMAVAKIPTVPVPYTPSKEVDVSPSKQVSNKTWYQKVGHLFASFKNLITIRHRAVPVHSLLSTQQFKILKQNISLKLALAQWAVINREQQLYSDCLQQIETWLKQDIQNQGSITNLLHSVNHLAAVNIVPKYPDLAKSLSALNYYLRNSLQLPDKGIIHKDATKAPAKKTSKPKVRQPKMQHNTGMEI